MATYNGTPGDDNYTGTANADTINGNGGNDTLSGAAGNDTISGGDGNDTLNGDDGNDTINGDAGDDTINGGIGLDNLSGGDGADTIDGGDNDDKIASYTLITTSNPNLLSNDAFADHDTLVGGTGNDTIYAGYGDTIDGGGGTDKLSINLLGGTSGVTVDFAQLYSLGTVTIGGGTITSIEFVQTVQGTNFADDIKSNGNIFGNGGNDTLDGRTGTSGTIDGGDGDDTIYASLNGPQYAYGGAGNDTIYGGGPTYGGDGDDKIYMQTSLYADVVSGGAGNDEIHGSSGTNDNHIAGDDGADVIIGGAGHNYLISGAYGFETTPNDNGLEHDVLVGGDLSDVLDIGYGDDADGGGGGDILILSLGGATSGVTVDFATILAGPVTLGGGTIKNMEYVQTVWGSANADTVTLATQAIVATVHGAGGNDQISAAGVTSAVVLYGDDGDDTITGGTQADTLYGGNGTDTIHGGGGNDTIRGDAGSDFLYGDDGDDTFVGVSGTDTIDGGAGTDTLVASGDISGVSITGAEVLQVSGQSVTLTPAQLQSFTTIKGNGYIILSTGGSVALSGTYTRDNSAWYFKLANSDTVFDAAGLTAVTAPAGITVQGGSAKDTITGTDSADLIYGNAGDDTINGGAGADDITGGTGVDIIHGGAGYDTIRIDGFDQMPGEVYDGGADGALLVFNSGIAIDLTTSTLINITDIKGTDVVMTAAQFVGLTSVKSVSQISIADSGTITGHVLVDRTNTTVIRLAPGGNVFNAVYSTFGSALLEIDGNTGSDTIYGTDLVDRLIGNDGSDTLYGGAGDDILAGGVGNDVLDGGAGGDTMNGGAGDDTYYLDNGNPTTGDRITELANGGFDIVYGSVSFTVAANVEHGILTGSGNINITGNNGADWLTGNSGDNMLTGLAGNDRLEGGLGTDTLIGGIGDDTYVYDGVDSYVENAGEGNDTIESNVTLSLAGFANIENITLTGSAAIDATGDDGDNILTGNDAHNVLTGGAGDDRLIGGAGADTMYGGTGDDVYVFDDAGDQAIENAGEGFDVIKSYVSYSLVGISNIEQLRLMGTADLNATGDAGVNNLAGNDGNNILDGGGGGDHMKGLAGNDTYIVRNVSDSIVEFAGNGDDTVKSAVNYALAAGVDIEHLWTIDASATTAINLTGNALSHDIQGNAGANVLTGGSGADVLQGFAGNDTLFGGGGHDIFKFAAGTGQDSVGDFVSGTDQLDLSAFGFANFAAVQAATHDVGGNAVIDLGGGNSVTLTGFLTAQLQSGDVIISSGGGANVEHLAQARGAAFETGDLGKADWHVGMWAAHDIHSPFIASGMMPVL